MGAVALGLLAGAELALTLPVHGLSPRECVAQYDPVSGVVFLAVLVVFAVMPLRVAGGTARSTRSAGVTRS
jgi:hypothetical protein